MIIPEERIPYGQWSYLGVPGGIPTDRTIYDDNGDGITASLADIDNTGATDVQPAIQAALDAATSGTVVRLPDGDGVFRIDSNLILRPNVTLRGAGMDATTIKPVNCTIQCFGSGDFDPGAVASWTDISAGNTKGSDTITVADTSSMTPAPTIGAVIQISAPNTTGQEDDPLTVSVYQLQFLRRQKAIVSGVTSTTVTFSPPMFADWSALSCKCVIGAAKSGVGLEDMTVDHENSDSIYGINWGVVSNSWVLRVKTRNVNNYSIWISDSVRCEVRECWLDRQDSGGTSHAGFMEICATSMLFTNNIVLTSFPGMEVWQASIGCVTSYNFFLNQETSLGIDTNHAPHNTLNLYEGNIVPNMLSDGYFGSNSDDTIFRSWITGFDAVSTYTISLKRFSRNFNLVGNILRVPDTPVPDDGLNFGFPNIGNGDFSGHAPPWSDWGTEAGPGGFQELDDDVEPSTILKANYDFFTESIPEDQALDGETLEDSMYLSEAPDFFAGFTWPPFDPEAPDEGTLGYRRIPAGARYLDSLPPTAPTITSPSHSTAYLSENFLYQITTDTDDAFSYAVDSGTLPDGLSLDTSTGLISGTPVSEASGITVQLTATNLLGPSDPFDFTVTVLGSRYATIVCVTSGTVTSPVVNAPFELL